MKGVGYIVLFVLAIGGLYLFMRRQQAAHTPPVQVQTPATDPQTPAATNTNSSPSQSLPFHGIVPVVQELPSGITLHVLPSTSQNNTAQSAPPYTGPAPSKYKRAVAGVTTPSLSDWFAAMATQTSFFRFVSNVVPKDYNISAAGESNYIIDASHWIRVYPASRLHTPGFELHSWAYPTVTATAPGDGYSVTPSPYVWIATYEQGATKGPSTNNGSIPAGSDIPFIKANIVW